MNALITAIMLATTLTAGQGVTAPLTTCDIKLNVTDPDPAGLNVRAAPDGAVIGVLKARARWVQVHVTSQTGAWVGIDKAQLIQDETGGPDPILFHGHGFVALSKLGIEELNEQAPIFDAPSSDAKLLLRLPHSDGPLASAVVLGCDGTFLKVRVSGVVGWTQSFCSDRLTTCN